MPPWWLLATVAAGSVIMFWRTHAAPVIIVLLPLACALGVLRLWQSELQWRSDPLLAFAEQTIILSGTVAREPDVRLNGQRLTLDVTAIRGGTPEQQSLHSRLLLTLPLYPEYVYGDALTVRCRLQKPERFDRFAYDEYLALDGVHVVCHRGTVLDHAAGRGNQIVRTALGVKQWFAGRLATTLPEPQASFAAALLVGARRGLPEATLAAFQAVGLTHLIALSGYNITILVSALGAAGRALGRSRRQIFWATVLLLMLFVIMTGAPASVVRAALMGVLVLVAGQAGRPHTTRYLLGAAATFMVAANPRILLHDAGFQLSFLATAGLLATGEWWTARLQRLPEWFQLRTSLATTCAASTLTLPLLVLIFGRLSLISPLANVLVLPAMPLAMLSAALSALPVVGAAVAWVAWGVLTWVLGTAQFLAVLPAASVTVAPGYVLTTATASMMMLMFFLSAFRHRHADT